jgi:hypothetical protein
LPRTADENEIRTYRLKLRPKALGISSLGIPKGKHCIAAIRQEAKQNYTVVTFDSRKTQADFELEKQCAERSTEGRIVTKNFIQLVTLTRFKKDYGYFHAARYSCQCDAP